MSNRITAETIQGALALLRNPQPIRCVVTTVGVYEQLKKAYPSKGQITHFYGGLNVYVDDEFINQLKEAGNCAVLAESEYLKWIAENRKQKGQ